MEQVKRPVSPVLTRSKGGSHEVAPRPGKLRRKSRGGLVTRPRHIEKETAMQTLSHTDRFTASEMAKTMRDGITTKENLSAIFGKRNVEKLGEHAADLARKAETVN